MDLTRRTFIGFLAAPAIIRVASLMPVKAWADGVGLTAIPHPVNNIFAANDGLIDVKEESLCGFADPRSIHGSSANHPKVLWPGVKAWWADEFDKQAAEWPAIFLADARAW